MDADTVNRYSKKFKLNKQITVPTFTIDSLITSLSIENIRSIPLLSVDCEGLDDRVVLAALNSNIIFELIVVEDKLVSLSSPSPSSTISEYLYKHNYRLMAKTPLNSFFVLQS